MTLIQQADDENATQVDALRSYFDYMGTTPVDPQVVQAMMPYLTRSELCGNPSASYAPASALKKAINIASQQVADYIDCDPSGLVWTSGATESINLAIKGAATFYQRQGKHLITLATEHKAVLQTFHALKASGFEITVLPVNSDGLLDLKLLKQAIRPDTILISVCHVNNETGVIQDLSTISEITRSHGILLHIDAAQSIGKIKLSVQEISADLVSLSAHKVYGPKGVGALYCHTQPKRHLTPLLHGGGQQQGKRSGTLATHQIVGMGQAYALAKTNFDSEIKQISNHNQRVSEALLGTHSLNKLNGTDKARVPHNLNIYFPNASPQTINSLLSHYVISSGASCNHQDMPSHVLQAMGRSDEVISRCRRISFGRFTHSKDITRLITACRILADQPVG